MNIIHSGLRFLLLLLLNVNASKFITDTTPSDLILWDVRGYCHDYTKRFDKAALFQALTNSCFSTMGQQVRSQTTYTINEKGSFECNNWPIEKFSFLPTKSRGSWDRCYVEGQEGQAILTLRFETSTIHVTEDVRQQIFSPKASQRALGLNTSFVPKKENRLRSPKTKRILSPEQAKLVERLYSPRANRISAPRVMTEQEKDMIKNLYAPKMDIGHYEKRLFSPQNHSKKSPQTERLFSPQDDRKRLIDLRQFEKLVEHQKKKTQQDKSITVQKYEDLFKVSPREIQKQRLFSPASKKRIMNMSFTAKKTPKEKPFKLPSVFESIEQTPRHYFNPEPPMIRSYLDSPRQYSNQYQQNVHDIRWAGRGNVNINPHFKTRIHRPIDMYYKDICEGKNHF